MNIYHIFINKKLHICTSVFLIAAAACAHSQQQVWNYSYDTQGRITSMDGPRADVQDITTFTYDQQGNLLSQTNALGHDVNYNLYDSNARVLSVTDANNVTTEFVYTLRGQIAQTSILHPSGSLSESIITAYLYDAAGRISQVTLPEGSEIYIEYDSVDRISAIQNQAGDRIEYVLDEAGNRTSERIEDSTGSIHYVISRVFDELNRVVDVVGVDGSIQRFGYDVNNNVVASTNGREFTSGRELDALGRLRTAIDPANGEINYTYNVDNQVVSVTDPKGLSTSYTYDVFGNLTSINSPDTGSAVLEYDAGGNVTRRTDSRGVITEYHYDALNRPTAVIHISNPEENIAYSYDDTSNGNFGIGRVTEIATSDGNIQYRFDHIGRVVEKRNVIDGEISYITYSYNKSGELLKLVYPSGREVRYELDALNRIQSVFTRAGALSAETQILDDATYLPFGPISSYRFGNGLTHSLDYDQNFRLTDIDVGGINPVLDRQYEYDEAANITGVVDGIAPSASQSFDYDSLDRLIDADGEYGLIDYTYDSVGNRLSRHIQSNGDDLQESYVYDNDSNQLFYIDKSTNGIPSQSREFAYDAAGNRIDGHGEDGSAHTYQYNAANRLETVIVNEGSPVTYAYNPLGQRTRKVKADGSEERYQYNESGQLLSVTDEDGAILREYIYRGAQQIALIARVEGATPVNPNPPSEPTPVLVLDESTVNFQGNHAIDTNVSGWTGTGFIDYIGEGHAEWTINIPSEGTYSVRVRYALSTGNRRLKIVVNDVLGSLVNFPTTGSFGSWSTVSETVVLPAGDVTFALATTGGSGANIDKIELQQVEPTDLIVLNEATATFQGAHQVASNEGGFHNAGFIDVIGEGQINWPLNVVVDTTFDMNIRYSLGAPSRPMQVLLNGVEVGYAGFQPTAGFAVWEFFNLDVTVPAGNHVVSLKTLGASGPNIDQIELNPTSTSGTPVDPVPPGELELFYIHDDHLGTPQVVTDTQQQVVWMADYLPFGQLTPNLNNTAELYSRFPGQYFDDETKLHYNYFRDYDPSIGRYIQSDPIGLLGGLNTYAYVGGNPLSFIDFFGLCRCNFPNSKEFMKNYPDYRKYSAADVWNLIGGSLNEIYGENSPGGPADSCAARGSYGLNKSGNQIPAGTPGGNRNWGGDGDRYIISARQFNKYLRDTYGEPDRTLTRPLQLASLWWDLEDGAVAFVSSNKHFGVFSTTYTDRYLIGRLGDVWILPTESCTCE